MIELDKSEIEYTLNAVKERLGSLSDSFYSLSVRKEEDALESVQRKLLEAFNEGR